MEIKDADARKFSVDMFCDDALGEVWPGLFLAHIVSESTGACGRHIVDDNVWFRGEAFEKFGQVVKSSSLAAIVGAAGRPEEEVAAGVA